MGTYKEKVLATFLKGMSWILLGPYELNSMIFQFPYEKCVRLLLQSPQPRTIFTQLKLFIQN